MDEIQFYKEFYFFENKRKDDLDGKVNLPILIISLIFSIHFFIFNQPIPENFLMIAGILSLINLIFVLFSIYFLQKSYSNLSNSYWYKELDSMKNIKKYRTELEKAQKEGAKEYFDEYVKDELANCASENRQVNISRTENLGRCKQFLFISILFTTLLSGIYIIYLLQNINYA